MAAQIAETGYLLSVASLSSFSLSYFGSSAGTRETYITLLTLSVITPIIGLLLTGGLLGFHIWVVGWRRLTTWAWIIERRRQADLKPKVLTPEDVRRSLPPSPSLSLPHVM